MLRTFRGSNIFWQNLFWFSYEFFDTDQNFSKYPLILFFSIRTILFDHFGQNSTEIKNNQEHFLKEFLYSRTFFSFKMDSFCCKNILRSIRTKEDHNEAGSYKKNVYL